MTIAQRGGAVRTALGFLAGLCLLAVLAVAIGGFFAWREADRPGPAESDVVVLLKPGDNVASIGEALKSAGAARVIVAAPVMPLEAAAHFRKIADDVVCLETPVPFLAVGAHYDDFRQLEDRDVIELLSAMNADDEFSRKRRDRQ